MLFALAVPGLVFSVFQCPSVSQRGGPHAVFSLFSQGILFCTNPVSLAHTIAFLPSFCFHSWIPDLSIHQCSSVLTCSPVYMLLWPVSSFASVPAYTSQSWTWNDGCVCPSTLRFVFSLVHKVWDHWLSCTSKKTSSCWLSLALVSIWPSSQSSWMSAFPCKLYSRNVWFLIKSKSFLHRIT